MCHETCVQSEGRSPTPHAARDALPALRRRRGAARFGAPTGRSQRNVSHTLRERLPRCTKWVVAMQRSAYSAVFMMANKTLRNRDSLSTGTIEHRRRGLSIPLSTCFSSRATFFVPLFCLNRPQTGKRPCPDLSQAGDDAVATSPWMRSPRGTWGIMPVRRALLYDQGLCSTCTVRVPRFGVMTVH